MAKKKRRPVISRKKLKEKRLAKLSRPAYSVGDLIQVNDDVMDINWQDLPLGGWVGKIMVVHRKEEGPQYDVQWTEETLEKCHPIYKQLAELEGLSIDKYDLLNEAEIHAFSGGEVILVDPVDVSQYTDRPLDPEDRTDRLRMIFGTKPLEWFPSLEDTEDEEECARLLKTYYDHLLAHLTFPFEATYVQRSKDLPSLSATMHKFTVEKLIDPKEIRRLKEWDDQQVLFCSGIDADGELLEVPLQHVICDSEPHKQLLEDHCSWVGDVYMMMGAYRTNSEEKHFLQRLFESEL